MLYTRMLFSCLVDADYTVSSGISQEEKLTLDVSDGLKNLYAYRQTLGEKSGADPVLNQFRNRLFECCGEAGEQEGGLFTLTAPTGTGKTLALLHFALRHCQYAGKERIIVVLPFLSLIEQSAGVYRKILPHVMEDHSQSRLPEEMKEHIARWDQPFLITTSVRFFESLFSDHPADCRKLHNLAKSVILFDEAQSLPVSLLSPTLKVMEELCVRYGCSVVFSTATQPDYTGLREINWSASELLPEHSEFYRVLRRTSAHWEIDTPTPLEEIARRMAQQQNVCTIVNLRAHARKLYQALAQYCQEEELFLLSTDLCPAHRTEVIQAIHRRQKEKLPCRVVSTSLIEAGVDVDFPVAYREQCGLDSLLQTAGRCNREGRRGAEESIVYRFQLDECSTPQMLRQNVSALDYTARHQDTLDTPRAIQLYFNELSDLRGPDAVDKHGILDAFLRGIRGGQFPFAQVAEEFRLIENAARTVYLPVGEGAALCEQLRSGHVTRTLLRNLGVYSVSCYKDQFDKLDAAGALELRPDGSAILTDTSCYSEKTGLAMDVETGIGLYF